MEANKYQNGLSRLGKKKKKGKGIVFHIKHHMIECKKANRSTIHLEVGQEKKELNSINLEK